MAPKTPLILCHDSTWPAFSIFNPNDWSVRSKPIINLCAMNYGLLVYTSRLIEDIFREAGRLCTLSFHNLRSQWATSKWDISRCTYIVDLPNLYLSIHSFLSAIKTFLDVLVQLTNTEGIVSSAVHGFHKKGNIIGGKLLQTLKNNATKTKIHSASLLYDLIIEHKKLWIDTAICNRDLLIHPDSLVKLTFILVLSEKEGNLNLKKIVKPSLDGDEFDRYAKKTLSRIKEFTGLFLSYIKVL